MSAERTDADPIDFRALAHRSLVLLSVLDLWPRSGPLRIAASRRPGAASASAEGSGLDLLVTVGEPALDAAAFGLAREAIAADGVVAVVVASTAAAGLVRAGLASGTAAPPVSASGIRELAAAADDAGLVLVEPEVSFVRSAAFSTRTPTDRAILSTILLGALARPLLFVHRARAPKNGLVRAREDRVLDGWASAPATPAGETTPPASLFGAAVDAIAASPSAIRGKDLLRAARERLGEAARARGERFVSSAADGPALAKRLFGAWQTGTVDLYAVDPSAPLLL